MQKVDIEAKDKIAVVRLNNGVTNPINTTLARELSKTVEKVRADFKGMVLAGGEKFFSMGFHLPELLKLDRGEMTHFFHHFDQALLDIYTLPLPTVCAIVGHAVAGGHILIQTCDYRLAAEGKTRIGLNEIKLGLPVPYLADLMLRQLTSDRVATDLLYNGQLVPAAQLIGTGLVDDVFPRETVEDRAIEKALSLTQHPSEGFAAIKQNRTEAVVRKYQAFGGPKQEQFLNCWFSEETKALLAETAKKF